MEKYLFCGKKDLIGQVARCLEMPELERLVQSFQGNLPVFENLRDRAKWLADFSGIWNFRAMGKAARDSSAGENARWLVQGNLLSEEQEKAALGLAQKWGMIEGVIPEKKEYDAILVLGGARMSCLYRTRYAVQLVREYGIKTCQVVGLTGLRAIADSERIATDTYAADADTEYGLMKAAFIQEFGTGENWIKRGSAMAEPNASWRIETYAGKPELAVLAAPSSEPEKRRANTADTLLFWQELGESKNCKRILLVTSQIYVPYQHMEAARILGLPYGYEIETTGFPREWPAKTQGLQMPENYLQEIRSAVLSMNKILEGKD